MFLRQLNILNYKNIEEAGLNFSSKINCLIGNNGEGKTNLLDAIYYLSFCHSMFSNVDSHVIQHEKDCFMLQGHYVKTGEETEEEVYVGMKRGARKQFRRNKKAYKKLSEHIGMIPLIIVSPDDVVVVTGGGEERRKLLDIVISQFDNQYIDLLNNYNKAWQQRNALLKMEEEPDEMLMAIWEEEMARTGEAIYAKRREFVDKFTPIFNQIYQQLSGCSEEVSLKYVSHCERGPLLEVIQRDRFKDRAVGYSLHGVHRDDLEMQIGGYPMKREGSQGQVKTYVISLKLAQYYFLKQEIGGGNPILLLDDIFDKLDAHRVERIIEMVGSDTFGQIFITDTNRTHLDNILKTYDSDYKIFNVEGGSFKLIST